MNHMSSAAPAMVALMMVAMMVPSITPTLWRHHRTLRAVRVRCAGLQTMLVGLAYASVWATIGLALFALSERLAEMAMMAGADLPIAPWAAGAAVLCAGMLQRSPWKAKQLVLCRTFTPTRTASGSVVTAWRDGTRLGVHCALSCAAPTAALFVAGLMDPRAMLALTVAITAERLAPVGPRIARLTGALALGAGVVMCVRALEAMMKTGVM